MSVLGQVLRHLSTGERVPVEIARRLSAEEVTALRTLELSLDSHNSWRVKSMKLLGLAQMLGKGRPSAEVFQEIVSQAASIIGTDVGYISLNNETTGMTTILATSGVVTEQFRTITMPMGAGVLGIVAATNKPAWTYDHSQDPDVTHIPEVDLAVEAEGIRGILGAPIQLGGNNIGALLVGDRRPRRFTTEDVTALTMLGSLTAVAVEIAQTLEDQRTALDQLTSTRERLRANVADLERLVSADREFLGALSNTATFAELAERLAHTLNMPVALWQAESDTYTFSAAPGQPVPATPADVPHRVPVEFNGRRLGAVCTAASLGRIDDAIVHHACSVFTALTLFHEELTAATSRKVDDLVYAAAIGTIGSQETARLRQLTGIDLSAPEELYFVGVHDPSGQLSRAVLERSIVGTAAITKHDQHFCVLLKPHSNVQGALQELIAPRESGPAAAIPPPRLVVSAVPLTAGDSLRSAHDMAMEFLRTAHALGLHSQVVTEELVGTVGMILGADKRAISVLTERSLSALLAYDAQHGSELEKTAYHYFSCGHSVPATAKALFVHNNTIRQRLERIGKLLGPGWDTGARSLDVHMALRVRALRGM